MVSHMEGQGHFGGYVKESDLNAIHKDSLLFDARKSRLDLRAAQITEVC